MMSTSGDTHLGGTDMDKTIVDYILDEFKKKEGIDLSSDTTAMTRIREAAEKAKIELSTIMETDINLPFISHDPTSGSKNLEMRMTRAKLEDLVNPIIEKCKPSIEKALSYRMLIFGSPIDFTFYRMYLRPMCTGSTFIFCTPSKVGTDVSPPSTA